MGGGDDGEMRRRALVLVVEVGLFVTLLGIPDGGLGVLWPSLRATFHRPVGDLGILVLAGTVPYLVASLVSGRAVTRIGFGMLTVAIGVVAVVAFIAWGLAPAWGAVLGAFALLGWSRGSADASVNAHASATEGVRRLGLLHASYGLGATAGPLVVSVVLALGGGWRVAVGVLAAAAAVVTAAAVAARDVPPATADGTFRHSDETQGPDSPNPDAEREFRHRDQTASADVARPPGAGRGGVAGILAVFVLYTAVEASTGAWAFTVLTQSRHLDRGIAGIATATYWGALTAGRVGVAAAGHRVGRGRVIEVGAALALVGVVLFAVGGRVIGPIGLPLAGLGFAPLFPVMVSVIPDRVGVPRSATVIGWAIGVAAVGGPAGTALAGAIANTAGVASIGAVLVVVAVILLMGGVAVFHGTR